LGFGAYVGGLFMCVLAVLVAIFGFVLLLGIISLLASSLDLFLGIALLVAALILFLYGRYLYLSSKPKGTVNVHNV
jgi:hypothetical protein